MDEILNHQDLLEKYAHAKMVWIYDTSTTIDKDIKELEKQCNEYAERQGLEKVF